MDFNLIIFCLCTPQQISGKQCLKKRDGAAATAGGGVVRGSSAQTRSGMDAAAAAKLTLRQHYYPEGGWGWIVCTAVFLVNMLTTGLQYSYGSILLHIVLHFHSSLVQAGEYILLHQPLSGADTEKCPGRGVTPASKVSGTAIWTPPSPRNAISNI